MARVFQTGFETAPYRHPWFSGAFSTSLGISSGQKRSGNYALFGSNNNDFARYSVYVPTEQCTSEMFFRVAMYPNVWGRDYAHMGIQIFDDANSEIAQFTCTSNGNSFYTTVKAANGVYWSPPATWSGWKLLEVRVKIDDTNGAVEFKYEGRVIRTFNGNTKGSGTVPRRLALSLLTPGNTNQQAYWDDIAINTVSGTAHNSWCGDGYILPIRPNANGDSSQWYDQGDSQANNYQAVDETSSDSDTTYVKSTAADQVDLYNLTDITLPQGHVINAVQAYAVARTVTAEGDTLEIGAKLDSTTDWASPEVLNTSYVLFPGPIMEKGPGDVAWSETNINALQIGIRSGDGGT